MPVDGNFVHIDPYSGEKAKYKCFADARDHQSEHMVVSEVHIKLGLPFPSVRKFDDSSKSGEIKRIFSLMLIPEKLYEKTFVSEVVTMNRCFRRAKTLREDGRMEGRERDE